MGIELLNAMRGTKGCVVVATRSAGEDGEFTLVSRASASTMAFVAESMLAHPRPKAAFMMETMLDHFELSEDDRVEPVEQEEAK